jgi:hypothetical protein
VGGDARMNIVFVPIVQDAKDDKILQTNMRQSRTGIQFTGCGWIIIIMLWGKQA